MIHTMLVQGTGAEAHRVDLWMAAELGLAEDVGIDQHFAERGRIGCLLGAVSQSPRTLRVGIASPTRTSPMPTARAACGHFPPPKPHRGFLRMTRP